ncbi:MAG TPA: type II secretion system protein GspM [Bryobacteraceae bacterium]|nr:type II secretion system protein GspM [Bryobacteraceae bacterium]
MTLTDRDKRALLLLGVVVLAVVIWLSFSGSGGAKVVRPADSTALAEKRLARLRQIAATVPAKQGVLKRVAAELNQREKGLLQTDTAAQAQAQLVQIVRKIGKAQSPPLDVRGVEIGQVRPLGDAYGEVSVSVSFDSGIEQLVDLLADLTAQPEIVASNEMRIAMANPKDKTLNVRLTVSGVVPKRLVPEKKGLEGF